jgi:hypothetical protein
MEDLWGRTDPDPSDAVSTLVKTLEESVAPRLRVVPEKFLDRGVGSVDRLLWGPMARAAFLLCVFDDLTLYELRDFLRGESG